MPVCILVTCVRSGILRCFLTSLLKKTTECLQETAAAMKQIARSGKKILFVGTKKQAKDIVNECAKRVNMPFVTERWLGGMLTNFNTVRKSVKKMQSIE